MCHVFIFIRAVSRVTYKAKWAGRISCGYSYYAADTGSLMRGGIQIPITTMGSAETFSDQINSGSERTHGAACSRELSWLIVASTILLVAALF